MFGAVDQCWGSPALCIALWAPLCRVIALESWEGLGPQDAFKKDSPWGPGLRARPLVEFVARCPSVGPSVRCLGCCSFLNWLHQVRLQPSLSPARPPGRVRLAAPWSCCSHRSRLQAPEAEPRSRCSPKLMSIELVMPSSHLILCHSLLLLPPVPPSIRVLSNESTLCMRWPKYWCDPASLFSFYN